MKELILTLSMLFATLSAFSQNNAYYRFAIGARAGSSKYTCGITAKTFLGEQSAAEVVVAPYKNGLSAAAFYEYHVPLFGKKEFQLYFGGGAHYTKNEEYQNWTTLRTGTISYLQVRRSAGFDAIVGIEYKFLALPLAVSIDLRPLVDFSKNSTYSFGFDQGLGIKLAL